MKRLLTFLKEEDGLEAVEYALLLGLVSAGTIAIIAAIGAWVSDSYQTVGDHVNDGE